MIRRLPACRVFLALMLGAVSGLSAQEGEVLRALPAVPRALPAQPVPPPPPTVLRPGAVVVPAPRPSQGTGDPEEDLFTYASLAFSNGYYDVAADRLEAYIAEYPRGKNLQAVFFRLGEARLKLGDQSAAVGAFSRLLQQFKAGDFVALAAYRLASINYKDNDLATAGRHFDVARRASEGRSQELAGELAAAGSVEERKGAEKRLEENRRVWLSSAYYQAYCLKAGGQEGAALKYYQAVAGQGGENEFRIPALREVARLSADAGDQAAALGALEQLAAEPDGEEAVKAEALIRSAILYGDGGDKEKAREILEEALELDPAGYWGAIGRYTLIKILYEDGDYVRVGSLFGKVVIKDLPDELRPGLLLAVGNAQRKRQLYVRAIDSYNTIDEYYPESEEAVEAGYLKLICFYRIKDRDLPEFVDSYVINMARRDDKRFIDRALLLRAEHHFRGEETGEAARVYTQIDPYNIPETVRAPMLYNRGWCEGETGEYKQAIQTYSLFLDGFQDHALAPSVYASRALAYRELNNPQAALEDLGQVLEGYPDSEVCELALQQTGLIHAEKGDWRPAIGAFKKLVEDFPGSVALAEAHYYSGKGHFVLKEFEEAIPHFEAAVEADKEYFGRSQMRVVLANYFLQRPDDLQGAIDLYLEKDEDANIDPRVFCWLGARRFEEDDFGAAARYLRLGATPERPSDTLPVVWIYLAEAESMSGKHEGATEAIGHYLDLTKQPSSRGRGFLIKAQSLLRAGELEAADEAAEEGLRLQKEGRINAELHIARGDIAFAQGEAAEKSGDGDAAQAAYRDAAAKYTIVSEIFIDPLITPTALKRAAGAFGRAGDTESAAKVQASLEQRFPGFE